MEFKQKLKIDDGTRKLSEGSQHGLEGVSSDEEVLIVEGGEVPPEKEEEEFYDKSKSFFDNISCEGAPGTNRYRHTDIPYVVLSLIFHRFVSLLHLFHAPFLCCVPILHLTAFLLIFSDLPEDTVTCVVCLM